MTAIILSIFIFHPPFIQQILSMCQIQFLAEDSDEQERKTLAFMEFTIYWGKTMMTPRNKQDNFPSSSLTSFSCSHPCNPQITRNTLHWENRQNCLQLSYLTLTVFLSVSEKKIPVLLPDPTLTLVLFMSPFLPSGYLHHQLCPF